jgi:hypothetical protein
MGQYYGSTATAVAREAVSAALQSGAVKLLGPGHADSAEANAKADATYLATLLNNLLTEITAKGPQ